MRLPRGTRQEGAGLRAFGPRAPGLRRSLCILGVWGMALLAAACSGQGLPPGVADGPLFSDLRHFTALGAEPEAGASGEFWDHWGDGQAELSGYRMTISRYGEPREAELALILVTEPHDRRTWIKDDEVESPDRVEVLKLNQHVEFLTGIYPYSVMTSLFSPVEDWGGATEERFQPVRIVHGVQEWCGAYSHRIWPGPESFRSLRLSYFAHEGERLREVEAHRDRTLYEDALLVQLRELDGPFADGGDWEGLLVPELWRLRSGHGGTEPVPARITRHPGDSVHLAGEEAAAPVPATRFELEAGDYHRTFWVEEEAPRRVLAWETSLGDRAELLATERLAYWELNRPGDEAWREALGLDPRGALPPAPPGGGPAGGC